MFRNNNQVAEIKFRKIKNECELIMFNMLGKEVKRISIAVGTVLLMLDKGNLESGIYFYNLFSNNKVIAKGKITIE